MDSDIALKAPGRRDSDKARRQEDRILTNHSFGCQYPYPPHTSHGQNAVIIPVKTLSVIRMPGRPWVSCKNACEALRHYHNAWEALGHWQTTWEALGQLSECLGGPGSVIRMPGRPWRHCLVYVTLI